MSVPRSLIPLALLVGATVVALSCRDASPVGVAMSPPTATLKPHSADDDGDDSDVPDNEDQNSDGDSLVVCRPLPYDSVTQTIGPAGGVVAVGHNWLVVPRGALREAVSITAVAPSDTVAWVRFQPAGLRFLSTVRLVLTYDNCRVPNGTTPRIALVTDSLRVIDFLASGVASPGDNRLTKGPKEGQRRVVGELQHFSNYAVAW